MKTRIIYILYVFILFSLSGPYIVCGDTFVPRKITLIKPGLIIENSTEEILYARAESAMEKLSIENKILYVPEHRWKKYQRYLNFDEPSVLADFYKNTGITGTINLFVEENPTYYVISVILFDFISREKKLQKIYLVKEQMVEELGFFTLSFSSLITGTFPADSKKNLKKRKYIPPPFVRNYHDYELVVSGGAGFHFSNPNINTAVNVFSFGAAPYCSLEATIHSFRVRLDTSFSFVFNYSLYTNENKKNYSGYRTDDNLFLWNSFTTLDLSGWLKNRIVALGGGVGVEKKSFNKRDISVVTSSTGSEESIYSDYYQRTLFMTFVYFHIAIQPYPDMVIYNDLGFFLCPQRIGTLTPAPAFAPFFRFGFRYVFYKNLFFEIKLPFYLFRYNTDEDDGKTSRPSTALYFGMGWRFAWSK